MKRKTNPLYSDDTVQTILEIASAYQKSKALLTACELDIFTVIGNDSKSSKEIAIQTDSDETAIDRLMNALVCMNLLVKNGNKFSNTKGARRFLVKGQPEFLGSMHHISHLWDVWGTLTQSVKLGTAAIYKDILEKDENWVRHYVDSMHWRAQMQAPDIVNMIDLSKVERILDLGCGSGIYTMEFVNAKPTIDATLFDLPPVVNQAKRIMEREGFTGAYKTIEGDFFKDDIGEGYDLVFVSEILPMFALFDNIKLLRKVYDSLNPGGRIIIQDIIVNDNRTEPIEGTILALNMLVNTRDGDAYNYTDFWIALKESFFKNVNRIDTEFGYSLIIGYK